jgi:hypothetical protein
MNARAQPSDDEGTWLRRALNAHTTSFDGDMPRDRRVAHDERAGFDVLATTDHSSRLPYGRFEVCDASGRRAWRNPLWI